MYGTIVVLAAGLLALLFGAKTFTNGIEWLGKRLNLSEGAVGSVLAAVGTALPETMVPIIAILFGPAGSAHEVGIGAILGAPFMLSTLAFGVVGVTKICYFRNSEKKCIEVKNSILMRDLKYFIGFYTLVISAAFVQIQAYKYFVAAMLLTGYIYYVQKTVGDGDSLGDMDMDPLYFWKKDSEPPLGVLLTQVAAGVMLIIGGATYFVDALGKYRVDDLFYSYIEICFIIQLDFHLLSLYLSYCSIPTVSISLTAGWLKTPATPG
jgi:cation:H+ antiporter